MSAPVSQVFSPSNLQELFSSWKNFPDAVIFAGGTEQIRHQGSRVPILSRNIISLEKLEELRNVSRTERYLEIGAMVKLNQIIQLGKIVPKVLRLSIENIAGSHLRNLATIGGNLCNPSRILDCFAPMIALDAQFELRTAQSTRWVLASRVSSLLGPVSLEPQELLTRIRIPLDPWNFTYYRKFRISGSNEPGGGILFIMKNQKNILTDIHVIYSGQAILREKNCEIMLKDKVLPLDKKAALNFVEGWKNYLSGIDDKENKIFPPEYENSDVELVKTQILNFIRSSILHISD